MLTLLLVVVIFCRPVCAQELRENVRDQALRIEALQKQIEQDTQRYRLPPRRQFIGNRSAEYRFAKYADDWRKKIELVSRENYPRAASEKKLYGNVVVSVSIKSDGTLEAVEIVRNSEFKILDDAALNIARIAAPYAPFPADIAKDTDILTIVRTWHFTRDHRMRDE